MRSVSKKRIKERLNRNGYMCSVETEYPYKFYLLHIPTGELVAGSYTKPFLERFKQFQISNIKQVEYEIIEVPNGCNL